MAFQEAWNNHDMKAMGDVFTEDADLINVVGTRWQGRADIIKPLGVFHRQMFKNEQIHLGQITIRSITPNVAVVVAVQTGSGEMVLPDGRGPRKPLGNQLDTFVVVHATVLGGWRMVKTPPSMLTHKRSTQSRPTGTARFQSDERRASFAST